MATNVSWLKQAIDESGMSVPEVAEKAGLSAPGLYTILKRGTCRDSSAKKLQSVLDTKIGPMVQKTVMYEQLDVYNLLNLPTVSVDKARSNFKRKVCDETPASCAACYETLRAAGDTVPVTRGKCKVDHGWEVIGGILNLKEQ
jgi:hypothetical protein